jgi:hypothetical protein
MPRTLPSLVAIRATSIGHEELKQECLIGDGDMPENNHSKTETAPSHVHLVEMAHAHWISQIVYVAAKLSLADQLDNGPKSAEELAGKTGTHAPSLYRLMRRIFSRTSSMIGAKSSA